MAGVWWACKYEPPLRVEPFLRVSMNAIALALLDMARWWIEPLRPTLTWWPPFRLTTLTQVPGQATRTFIMKGFAVPVAHSYWIPLFPGSSHGSESLIIFLRYMVSFYIPQDDKFKLLGWGFVKGVPGPRLSTKGFQNCPWNGKMNVTFFPWNPEPSKEFESGELSIFKYLIRHKVCWAKWRQMKLETCLLSNLREECFPTQDLANNLLTSFVQILATYSEHYGGQQ